MTIPKNLIVFFHDPKCAPKPSRRALALTKQANPDFNVIRLNDQSAQRLFDRHMPHMSDLYRRNRIPASRCNMIRHLALYVHGGIYLDMAIGFKTPIQEVFDLNRDLILVRRDDLKGLEHRPHAAHMIDGIIGSIPHSEFSLRCLKEIFFNLSLGHYNHNVFAATGPAMMTEIYRRFKDSLDVQIHSAGDIFGSHAFSKRDASVNNTWVEQQLDGIIDPAFYNTETPQDALWKATDNRGAGQRFRRLFGQQNKLVIDLPPAK